MYWIYQHFFSDNENDVVNVNTLRCEEENPCTCSWSMGWLEATTDTLVSSDKIQDSRCFTLAVSFRSTLMTTLREPFYRSGDSSTICQKRFGFDVYLRSLCLKVARNVELGTMRCVL